MRWVKLGLVFCPDGTREWMRTHASTPSVEPGTDELVRVHFSCRDAGNRSSVGSIEIDIRRPDRLLRVSDRPVLGPGPPGTFDDSGVSVGCVTRVGERDYLYYVGWNLAVTVPWRNSIGLAVRNGGEEAYRKVSRAPVMDRSEVDPFSLSYPWVVVEGGVWRMWYGSNDGWGPARSDMRHVIRYAQSADGVRWERQGHVAIPLAGGDECAVARPCVVRMEGRYRMWYSRKRGDSYRIGYAESPDGVRWERQDARAGIETSESGWDSEMIEYPCVFQRLGKYFMFYNGNGYGKTGVGLAELADAR